MRRHWIRLAILSTGLAMMVLVTPLSAKIPEPDNVVYGLSREDAVIVTLEVDGEQIATYRMGENPDAGGYYVLRVPIDSLEPQSSGTARPGDPAKIHVNGEANAVATLIIGPRGSISIVHLAQEDADADGIPDPIDRCPETLDSAAVDRDGCSDVQIARSDWDEDGFTYAEEIAAGSDPNDPDSFPEDDTNPVDVAVNAVMNLIMMLLLDEDGSE